jgi:non-homologous end joining protein Ku
VEIEASVAELVNTASQEFADLACYSRGPSISFPLKSLLVACTDLRNQLEEVRGKQATVVETKRSIVEQLDNIQHLIEKRKRNWEQKRMEDIGAVATAAENELKTGWLVALHDLLIYYPNITAQTIIFFLSFRASM